jgi:hypothetical protein
MARVLRRDRPAGDGGAVATPGRRGLTTRCIVGSRKCWTRPGVVRVAWLEGVHIFTVLWGCGGGIALRGRTRRVDRCMKRTHVSCDTANMARTVIARHTYGGALLWHRDSTISSRLAVFSLGSCVPCVTAPHMSKKNSSSGGEQSYCGCTLQTFVSVERATLFLLING